MPPASAASPHDPDRPKFPRLQTLRFVAAVMVVIYHANIFVQGAARGTAGLVDPAALDRAASIGRAGVPIFFVISGFIILHVARDQFGRPGAAARFALNRMARIYPLYWMMLAVWLLISVDSRADLPDSPGGTIGMLALWPTQADNIVTVAWTLAFEVYFYAVFAIALLLPRKPGLVFVAGVLLTGVALGKVLDLVPATPAAEAPYGVELVLFLAGMAIALVLHGQRVRRWLPSHHLACGIGAVLWLSASPWMRDLGAPAILAYGPPAVLVVASAVFRDAAGSTGRLARRLAPLGDSSYALYLSHIPVMILVQPVLTNWAVASGLDPVALMAALVVLSVTAGHLIYLVCERPVQQSLRRRMAGLQGNTARALPR